MPTREEIEARAYEIYLRRGDQDGDPLGDWAQAERELAEELDNSLPSEVESFTASSPSPKDSEKRSAKLQTK